MELVLPLTRHPLPVDVADWMRREVEAVIPAEGGVPFVVGGATEEERVAALRTAEAPRAARVERALAGLPGVLWTSLVGELVLPGPMGLLRHAFVRLRHPGRWEAWSRPFVVAEGELTWLDDWSFSEGFLPDGPFFPTAEPGRVRFVEASAPVEPTHRAELPDGASPEDVTRVAGIWMESWFVHNGFLAPSVVCQTGRWLDIYLLPRGASPQQASDLAVTLAQGGAVRAIGVFSRGKDMEIEPPAENVQLVMEFRDGPTLTWARRFRLVEDSRARWLDAAGFVSPLEKPRRWFPASR